MATGNVVSRGCAHADQLVIVIDSREQRPWSFPLPTVVAGLPAGDYSVVGHELEAAIERKSLADFASSVTWQRERFWRELEKLAPYALRAVVIEADMGDAQRGLYPSKASPWAILTSALAITADFGIPVVWAHNPATAARCAEWMLRRFAERRSEVA